MFKFVKASFLAGVVGLLLAPSGVVTLAYGGGIGESIGAAFKLRQDATYANGYLKPRGYLLANKSDTCLQTASLLWEAGKVPPGTKPSAEVAQRQAAILAEGIGTGCFVLKPPELPMSPYVKQLFSMKRPKLVSTGACAQYGGWADDVYNDMAMPANEKATSLDGLFADAKQKGCLK